MVLVRWFENIFGPWKLYADVPDFFPSLYRPVFVVCYCKHSILIDGINKEHLFAVVTWPQPHPSYSMFGKPVELYYCNEFDDFISIIPIGLLSSLCAYKRLLISGESVYAVTSINQL